MEAKEGTVMESILRFMKDDIVAIWIAPIVIAAVMGIWKLVTAKVMERRKGMPFRTYRKRNVNVFEKYCEKNRIHSVVSYGDANALHLITELNRGKIRVKAEVDLQNKPRNNDNRNFVMILLKYIPKCNMTYFYNKKYSFMFDVKSEKGICGMQVEVKDIYGAKVIDEFVKVENEWRHYSFKLNEYGESEAWKEIQEICFTFFTEKKYILKNKGWVEIEDCILKVE